MELLLRSLCVLLIGPHDLFQAIQLLFDLVEKYAGGSTVGNDKVCTHMLVAGSPANERLRWYSRTLLRAAC